MRPVPDFLLVMGRFEEAAQLFQAQYRDVIQAKDEYRCLGSLSVDIVFWKQDLIPLDDGTQVAYPPDVVQTRSKDALKIMDKVEKILESYKEGAVRFEKRPGKKSQPLTQPHRNSVDEMRQAMRALRTLISILRDSNKNEGATAHSGIHLPTTISAAAARIPTPPRASAAGGRAPTPPIKNATAARMPVPGLTSALPSRMPTTGNRSPAITSEVESEGGEQDVPPSQMQLFIKAMSDFESAAGQFHAGHQALMNFMARGRPNGIAIQKAWPEELATWRQDLQTSPAAAMIRIHRGVSQYSLKAGYFWKHVQVTSGHSKDITDPSLLTMRWAISRLNRCVPKDYGPITSDGPINLRMRAKAEADRKAVRRHMQEFIAGMMDFERACQRFMKDRPKPGDPDYRAASEADFVRFDMEYHDTVLDWHSDLQRAEGDICNEMHSLDPDAFPENRIETLILMEHIMRYFKEITIAADECSNPEEFKKRQKAAGKARRFHNAHQPRLRISYPRKFEPIHKGMSQKPKNSNVRAMRNAFKCMATGINGIATKENAPLSFIRDLIDDRALRAILDSQP